MGRVLLRPWKVAALRWPLVPCEWQAVSAGLADGGVAGKRPCAYCSPRDVPRHAPVRAGASGCQNRKTHGQAWLPSMLLWHMTKAPCHKKTGRHKSESRESRRSAQTGKGPANLWTGVSERVLEKKMWSSPLSSFVSLPRYRYHADNRLSMGEDMWSLVKAHRDFLSPHGQWQNELFLLSVASYGAKSSSNWETNIDWFADFTDDN